MSIDYFNCLVDDIIAQKVHIKYIKLYVYFLYT